MTEEWRAATADQLLAFTCCWPELEEPVPLLASDASRRQATGLAAGPVAARALRVVVGSQTKKRNGKYRIMIAGTAW
jgi:hypothetical protein